jgi:hypothetical protein
MKCSDAALVAFRGSGQARPRWLGLIC